MLFSLIKTATTVSAGATWKIGLPGQPEPSRLDLLWTLVGRRRKRGSRKEKETGR